MSDHTAYLQDNLPFIQLVYSSLAPEIPGVNYVSTRLADIDPSWQIEETIRETDTNRPHIYTGQYRFGRHLIQVTANPNPIPSPIIDQTVLVSHWQPQIKAALRHHQSHLTLTYLEGSTDPVDRMTALYGLTHGLDHENLLGVVNPPAWTAHPKADFLIPEKIQSFNESIPFLLWIGYVKFFIDKINYWLVTKGHHLFDVPDLAYRMKPDDDAQAVMDTFINLFYFLYEQDATVTAGDTAQIKGIGQTYHFLEVTELTNLLMGPAGTLVIEKTDSI